MTAPDAHGPVRADADMTDQREPAGSTSTWNPERTFPRLGDSLPCPTPEEEAAEEEDE